jgi:hypothetical protein
MTFNLISKKNGVGLSQDVAILTELLQRLGHTVDFTDWQEMPSKRYDVNVFFELLNPSHLSHAKHNVGVFNLEWFLPRWVQYLPCFTQLWARSKSHIEILKQYNQNTQFIGWTSRDLYNPEIKKQRKFLHLRGKNSYKGTQAVIDCWAKHSNLPELIIVTSEIKNFEKKDAPNITYLIGYQTDEKIRELMNECQFHLCPSECEGFGYYIVEGISCKALVLATDAPPMNEHISKEIGILIPYEWEGKTNLSPKYKVEHGAIYEAAIQAMRMPEMILKERTTQARKTYLSRKVMFENLILKTVKQLI